MAILDSLELPVEPAHLAGASHPITNFLS